MDWDDSVVLRGAGEELVELAMDESDQDEPQDQDADSGAELQVVREGWRGKKSTTKTSEDGAPFGGTRSRLGWKIV